MRETAIDYRQRLGVMKMLCARAASLCACRRASGESRLRDAAASDRTSPRVIVLALLYDVLHRRLPALVRCRAMAFALDVWPGTNVCMGVQTETTTLLPERCAPTILTHSPTVVSSEAHIDARDTQSG